MDKLFGAILYKKVRNSDSEQGIVLSAINPEESVGEISQTGYVLRCMDKPERFCCNFVKGDNFCEKEVAPLVVVPFQIRGYSLRKINAAIGS